MPRAGSPLTCKLDELPNAVGLGDAVQDAVPRPERRKAQVQVGL